MKFTSKLRLFTLKIVSLSAGLLCGFTIINSASAVLSPSSSQPPEAEVELWGEPFLIAASAQLNNLLYNNTIRSTSLVRYHKVISPRYDSAYYLAWLAFSDITIDGSIGNPRWSTSAGWIYPATLIGGGTANIREYSSSLPLMPTIDIINHNTPSLNGQSFSQVREIKFRYNPPNICPVSTSTC